MTTPPATRQDNPDRLTGPRPPAHALLAGPAPAWPKPAWSWSITGRGWWHT